MSICLPIHYNELSQKERESIMYSLLFSADCYKDKKERLYHCTACTFSVWFGDYKFVLLQSYETIIAFYDVSQNTLVSFGYFSATSTQHLSKFRKSLYNNDCPSVHRTEGYSLNEINFQIVKNERGYYGERRGAYKW